MSPYANETLDRLEERLNLAMQKLERVSKALNHAQKELDSFLDEYFAQISLPMAELFRLRRQRAGEDDNTLAYLHHTDAVREIDEAQAELHQEVRGIYRKLAQQFHPDSPSGLSKEEAHERMSEINRAFRERKYGQLLRLSHSAECAVPQHTSRHQLLARLADVQKLVETSEVALRGLYASPAYQLKQRVLKGRLTGENVIQSIVEDIARDIRRETLRIKAAEYLKA